MKPSRTHPARVQMQAGGKIIRGTVLAPLRAHGVVVGYQVQWDGVTGQWSTSLVGIDDVQPVWAEPTALPWGNRAHGVVETFRAGGPTGDMRGTTPEHLAERSAEPDDRRRAVVRARQERAAADAASEQEILDHYRRRAGRRRSK